MLLSCKIHCRNDEICFNESSWSLNQKYLARSDNAFYAMSYFVFTSTENFVSIIKVN